jgi:Transposase DDE domain
MAYNVKLLDKYSELQLELQKKLPNQSVWFIKFLVLFMVASIKVGSINLSKLGNGMDNSAKKLSNLRTISRYLYDYKWCLDSISKLIMSYLPNRDRFVLLMDKTSWKFGRFEFNILMLAVAYEGIAIPLLWTLLNDDKGNGKDGVSTEQERIDLMERFKELFGFGNIEHLSADREFIGSKWFGYLKRNNIGINIRIRNNAILRHKGKPIQVKDLFKYLSINGKMTLSAPRYIYEHKLYLSAILFINDEGNSELLIVASFTPDKSALKKYSERWQIETMFKALKSNGFNLEETHLESIQALDKLLYLIALSFIWAYLNGIYLHKKKPIKILKHGFKQISIFKLGFETLQRHFLANIGQFDAFVEILSYS